MYRMLFSGLLRLSQVAVWIGGAMMLLAALMVSADVLSRKLFGVTMGGSDEISGYLFAISTAFAFPYALLCRANVRIDVAYARLPARLRGLADIFALALLGAFAAVVTWRILATVRITWENGAHSITPLRVPLILPQGLWLAGWGLFCAALAVVLYGLAAAWARGEDDEVQALGGALSLEEEIGAEIPGTDAGGPGPAREARPC
ncbi:TRAP transporter small permease subunit [Poseidonocella sp. HB161398]|uniref:TRAP transporter small permease subunit n=1 Tax=Poseidonocella sp. HB161398 TaxID=2320855 RepID=UPI001F0ED18F|nr:TRAP transporter small permease [Poseidonocella sp. HB161398]